MCELRRTYKLEYNYNTYELKKKNIKEKGGHRIYEQEQEIVRKTKKNKNKNKKRGKGRIMKVIKKIQTNNLTVKPQTIKEVKFRKGRRSRTRSKRIERRKKTNPIIKVEAQFPHEHVAYAGTHHPHS